jgi:hypothetical protein
VGLLLLPLLRWVLPYSPPWVVAKNGSHVYHSPLFLKRIFIPSIKNMFCGHHSAPSFDHRSSSILQEYGPPHGCRNLGRSETTKPKLIFDRWYYISEKVG